MNLSSSSLRRGELDGVLANLKNPQKVVWWVINLYLIIRMQFTKHFLEMFSFSKSDLKQTRREKVFNRSNSHNKGHAANNKADKVSRKLDFFTNIQRKEKSKCQGVMLFWVTKHCHHAFASDFQAAWKLLHDEH